MPNQENKNLRVRISLPPNAGKIFYNDSTNAIMAPLHGTDGLVFPILPQITIGMDAKYQELAPTHSNFPYQMYQNSSIKPITLTGEFLVRTEKDAQYVNAGLLFLKSLTRMFNYLDKDFSGAPPHVARLHGLGFVGFDNLPVVIGDVSINFPDSVDHISFRLVDSQPETARIPVNFSVTITMMPVFSRDFITNTYNTTNFSKGVLRLMGTKEESQKTLEGQDSLAQQLVQASETKTNDSSQSKELGAPQSSSNPVASKLSSKTTSPVSKSNFFAKALGGKLGGTTTTLKNLATSAVGGVITSVVTGSPTAGAISASTSLVAALGQQPGIFKPSSKKAPIVGADPIPRDPGRA